MTYDPERWAVLGQAIRDDRVRQGLTRKALVARVKDAGLSVTERTIGELERANGGKGWRTKPPSLEPTVIGLGWKSGWTDRILAGESPADVVNREVIESPAMASADLSRARLSELASSAYRFSGAALSLGVPEGLCDEFERLVRRILDSVPTRRMSQSDVDLAAYRPHAEGEGVPADDAARIREALNGNS